MASVCFYFQVHQPFRLRRYSVFESEPRYFDDDLNGRIALRVAEKCYLPAAGLLLDLVRQHEGRFRIAFSLTGIVVEQLKQHCPRAITLIRELVRTGCCELLAETYHHSLAFLYSRQEFLEQVRMHDQLMEQTFGVRPTVFRNTELIYNNELADVLAPMKQYHGVITEGADHVLKGRSPGKPYHPPGHPDLAVLVKNYTLSDDIAFRFSDSRWREWPLTSEKYVQWIDRLDASGTLCNLFMDFETFGEHQWAQTGIFEFLRALPDRVLETGRHDFMLPSECMAAYEARDVFDAPNMISWADTERDLSAWLGNAMQSNALHELYRLEEPIKASGDTQLLRDWRYLTASDHFYYMCTKYFEDGQVHKYFNPYESPYDSYINFMNVLENLKFRLQQLKLAPTIRPVANDPR